ncbi:MAG: protoporphyrinogen oxidase HemJ [Candidatus Berkiellales bacterium]
MLWVKAFHIIAMVAWFAGVFYLPRLFVYHTNLGLNEVNGYERFCTMERRLFWGIMTPSAIITLILGTGLVHMTGYSFQSPPLWLTLKLALVAVLILFHGYCGIIVKKFKQRQNKHSALFYRWFNEFPVLILIGSVLLVVLKPT